MINMFCCLVVLLSGGFVVSCHEDRPYDKGTILQIRLQTDKKISMDKNNKNIFIHYFHCFYPLIFVYGTVFLTRLPYSLTE